MDLCRSPVVLRRSRRHLDTSGRRNVCVRPSPVSGSVGFTANRYVAGDRSRLEEAGCQRMTAGVRKLFVHAAISVGLTLVDILLLATTFGGLGSF
jgi:hypothetical protein